MKIKIRSIIFLTFVFLTANAQAYAATITGDAYSESIGIIHFDYTTAVNPFAACTTPATPNSVNCPLHADYGKYHLGAKRDFYLPPTDDNYAALGTSDFTASIDNLAQCADEECSMKGFIWSDSIGWIIVDGSTIRTQAFGGDAGQFPDSDFARVSYSDPTKGIFKGYMWSEYTGWIKLSSDTFNPSNPATATNWGVWMDISPDSHLLSPLTNANCGDTITDETACNAVYTCQWRNEACMTKTIPLGRPLNGFAWSENLGWIKFSKEATDISDFDFGAYSMWVPDTTPPILSIINYTWFANKNIYGHITWDNIAYDPDSGIDLDNSTITITPIASPDFDGCEVPGAGDILSFIPGDHPDAMTLNMLRLGLLSTASKGFCAYNIIGTIKNTAGLETPIPAGTVFYVRAGDFDPTKSSVKRGPQTTALADGKEYIEYLFSAKDLTEINPIVPVKVAAGALNFNGANNVIPEANPANWVRNVGLKYSFDSSNIFFNTLADVHPTPYPLPVKIDDVAVSGSTAIYSEDGDGLVSLEITPNPLLQPNHIQVASYAPTADCGLICNESTFTLNQLDFTVTDTLPEAVANPAFVINETTDSLKGGLGANPLAGPTGADFEFTPAIITLNGEMSTDTLIPSDNLITASFKVENVSTISPITDVTIDNSLELNNVSEGIGEQVLDLFNINLTNPGYTDDSNFDRKDPINQGLTRYEMSNFADGSNTIFHSDLSNLYDPARTYNKDWLGNTIDPMTTDGYYNIDIGTVEVPDILTIDRSDPVSFYLSTGALDPQQISFKLGDLYGVQLTTDVKFNLKQYLAYRITGAPLPDYAVYDVNDIFNELDVKRIGVQATGIVTGEKVFETISGREFQTVTSPGLAELKQQMRDNVADLTRNIEECWPDSLSGLLSIANDNCVKVDANNNTVIAIYGNDSSTLELGSDVEDLTVPDGYKYTIIVRGGANVFIKNNIKYQDADNKNTSFGLIVLAGTDGNGGNVYIAPNVTNVVGLLYAEGSLMSMSNDNKLYYLDPSTVSNDLKNQLYWQGSIVSRNTIGGAANRVVPEGIDCLTLEPPATDKQICARAFDMDFLRRFVVNTTKQYVADEALFSGGGSCTTDVPPVCTLGPLPTKIQLDGTLINITNSKTDPFYIEKDSRPAPPGFSTSAGFERTQEIR